MAEADAVTLADVALALYRIRPHLPPSPLEPAPNLGKGVYLKLENVHPTHSFKIRGAINAAAALETLPKAAQLVACSSGNFGQAIALATTLFERHSTVLMPQGTPRKKIDGVLRYGGTAALFGENYDASEQEALRRACEEGQSFISPYNNPYVVAGAGTISLELLERLPDLARVVIPVSGGGLISGMCLALKALKPSIETIGVCAEAAPAMYNAFYGTNLPQVNDTLAEALCGEIEEGSITVPLSKKYVDRIVLVSEEAIARAMRWAVAEQGWIVEGGGAVGIAALLEGVIPCDGQVTGVVISGGNLDVERLQQILDTYET